MPLSSSLYARGQTTVGLTEGRAPLPALWLGGKRGKAEPVISPCAS